MPSADDYVDAGATLRRAADQLTRLCAEVQALGIVPKSVHATEADGMRRTPGGGGRERAELLASVRWQGADLYRKVAVRLAGIADLLKSSPEVQVQQDLTAPALLLRSADEHAGTAQWLVSDLRGHANPDLMGWSEMPWSRPAELTDEYSRRAQCVSGATSCRRLLIWWFEQLRHDRNLVRELRAFEGDPVRKATESMLVDLDSAERDLIQRVTAAGWTAEPEQELDGSRKPAALIREGGTKPERMPLLSDLAATPSWRYALLSKGAHPSLSALGIDYSLEDMLLFGAFMTLTGSETFFNWCGVHLVPSTNAMAVGLAELGRRIWQPEGRRPH